jgi:hypothetical protein
MAMDTDTLIGRSARLDLSGLDFEVFGERPLDEESRRCLRYMHDVENHTVCYLRDLLVTSAHRDPEITAFLSCWCFEEYWHGEALGRILAAHGEGSGSERVAALRRSLGRRDAWRPLAFGLASKLTRHAVAVNMAWGAINELTTRTAYGRLAQRAGHPVLTELLKRIMRQEGRHIDFYAAQARQRLAASAPTRRLTRLALTRAWAPVGSGLMPPAETAFMAKHLFSGPGGAEAAHRVDTHVDRLPGLQGLRLLQRAVETVSTASEWDRGTGS